MNMAEVQRLLGPPERVLSLTRTPYGYEEVWQYRTSYNEVFALEFMNEILEGYQFLYEDLQYAPPSYYYRPPYGKPIFPNYRPNRPIYSKPPHSGNNNNHNNGRPPSNTQTPEYTPPRGGTDSGTGRPGNSTGTRPIPPRGDSTQPDNTKNSTTTTRESSNTTRESSGATRNSSSPTGSGSGSSTTAPRGSSGSSTTTTRTTTTTTTTNAAGRGSSSATRVRTESTSSDTTPATRSGSSSTRSNSSSTRSSGTGTNSRTGTTSPR